MCCRIHISIPYVKCQSFLISNSHWPFKPQSTRSGNFCSKFSSLNLENTINANKIHTFECEQYLCGWMYPSRTRPCIKRDCLLFQKPTFFVVMLTSNQTQLKCFCTVFPGFTKRKLVQHYMNSWLLCAAEPNISAHMKHRQLVLYNGMLIKGAYFVQNSAG